MKASVAILSSDHWQRLKEIRLRALKSNPEAFGPKYEEELAHDETTWRKRFIKEDYLLASINQIDVGMLYIEVLKGDHGATCWIGGGWTDPSYRLFLPALGLPTLLYLSNRIYYEVVIR